MTYEDPASQAARWRTRGDYYTAAMLELHFGEYRTWGPQGQTQVSRGPWKIPDCRKIRLSDFRAEEIEAYKG